MLGQSGHKTALSIAQQVVREEKHFEEMEWQEREEINVDALIKNCFCHVVILEVFSEYKLTKMDNTVFHLI